MNEQDDLDDDYMDEDDFHYIKSLQLNAGHISQEDRKFILDSIVHGDRIFFDGLTISNKSWFMARIFSRYASDYDIERYMDEELGYDAGIIRTLIDKEDDNSRIFLERFANVPDLIVDNNAKSAALSRIRKEFQKNLQPNEVENLMEPFKHMTTEQLVTFYKENYLK